MKRSEINQLLSEAINFLEEMNFKLPPFAFRSLNEWQQVLPGASEIVDNMLGWDITDFSSGDFRREGLLLFTLRNGNPALPQYPKPYAEKILVIREDQETPLHFHWNKMEDIINRGGGNLLIELWKTDENEKISQEPLIAQVDGEHLEVKGGTIIRLMPGQSITLPPYQYHRFWAENGTGTVLAGEVSMVNDDKKDNRFLKQQQRFSLIEEDEKPMYLLVSDYESYLSPN